MSNINGSVFFYTLYFLLLAVIIVLYRYGYFNKKYKVWHSAYKDYNRYQKEYLEDGSWCSFIEYYKSIHNVVQGRNAYDINQEIAHITECIKLLSTNGTTIKEYFQQNKFRFKKEYAKMIAEIRVAKKVSSETDVVIEEALLNNDVASENISAIDNDKKEIQPKKVSQDKITPFEDYLWGTDDEKKAICKKVAEYLEPDYVIGKHIAIMILALEANKQLRPIDQYTSLYKSIKNQFKANIGSNSGITDCLNPHNKKHIPAQKVEPIRELFKL